MTHLLEAQALRKTFGDFVAVDNVSFRLNPGKIVGLRGPKGAGKTTTIKLLIGLAFLGVDPLWALLGWLVLVVMGYGLFSFLVSLGFRYPNLTWDDPRRMLNRQATIPNLVGTALYSLVTVVVALVLFVSAQATPGLALPIIMLGLSLLAGGTWLFASWCTRRSEAAWPAIGVE